MPATSDLLNRPCVSEDMAKLAHQRYAQGDYREVFLDGVRYGMAGGWMPIATAPRDGTSVLLFTTDHGVVEARFEPGRWVEHYELGREYEGAVWVCGDDAWQIEVEEIGDADPAGPYHDGTATHWMPLPNPPSAEANHAR